ncbi:hypothetical protein [Guptibacillus hwajinpoensis]|uniref:DUF3899 domain-containing protein n=1 Tax=Guptibacillus hwajinpoensis TaxID=208199 RepID=A0ABU0K2C8_9BACL|nr:hypothetical protein [Alkalihalobacillus hemicentroti]MDQ0483514.1 hypothetical protein [Alkalihalobacillus hemicentroti]
MMGWTIALIFWVAGVVIVGSPRYLFHRLEEMKTETADHSKASEASNKRESIFFFIETKALDSIPWWVITVTCVTVGLFLIAFGVIALVFSY